MISHDKKRRLSFFGIIFVIQLHFLSCYKPIIVEGSLVKTDNPILPEKKIPGLKLFIYNTGMNQVSSLLVGSPNPWRPAPAFLIEHPKEGLIVFDCGLGPEIAEKGERALHPVTALLFKSRSRPGSGLVAQMRDGAFSEDKVKKVILSHLHFDHTGEASSFKKADFYMGAGEELESGSRMDGIEKNHFSGIEKKKLHRLDFSNSKSYGIFPRTLDILGDGSLLIIAGNGHSPGGISLLINLPEGPVLLTGDEVVHFDWLNSDDVQRITKNPERSAEFRNRIRSSLKQNPNLVIIPGHDTSSIPFDRKDISTGNPVMFQPGYWPLD